MSLAVAGKVQLCEQNGSLILTHETFFSCKLALFFFLEVSTWRMEGNFGALFYRLKRVICNLSYIYMYVL